MFECNFFCNNVAALLITNYSMFFFIKQDAFPKVPFLTTKHISIIPNILLVIVESSNPEKLSNLRLWYRFKTRETAKIILRSL